jgi:parallel beta-helix repeat protein
MSAQVPTPPTALATPTAITMCPFLITTPGHYYLAMDLTCPDVTNAITIDRTSGVHLQLNGHTLQGSNSARAISVQNSTAIVIQGPGTITGFGDGLSFFNVALSKVMGVTTTRNIYTGVFVVTTTNSVFEGNVATLNGRYGISMVAGGENKIINNLVTNNEVGIDLVFTSLNKIHANTASSNTLQGISLMGTQNKINGNTALNNAVQDMLDREPNCDDNQWRGNRFDTANQPCIR